MSTTPYEAPQANLDTTPVDAPELWNPRAAIGWSLLFTPAFGAYLHMRNWQALGDQDKAQESRMWMIGYLIFLLVMLFIPAKAFTAMGSLSRPIGIALLVAWSRLNAQAQVTTVKERFGTNYPRKSWLLPIVCAIGCMAALVGVIVAFAALTANPGDDY